MVSRHPPLHNSTRSLSLQSPKPEIAFPEDSRSLDIIRQNTKQRSAKSNKSTPLKNSSSKTLTLGNSNRLMAYKIVILYSFNIVYFYYQNNNHSTIMKRNLLLVCSVLLLATAVHSQDRPPIDPSATSFSGVFSLNWTAGYCFAMVGTQN